MITIINRKYGYGKQFDHITDFHIYMMSVHGILPMWIDKIENFYVVPAMYDEESGRTIYAWEKDFDWTMWRRSPSYEYIAAERDETPFEEIIKP